MRRLYFIVNPISGSGEGRERFERVRKLLDEAGADYGFRYTEKPLHAIDLAREALEADERAIVAVGGDGTVREVASVLVNAKGVEFGILPFGTGNDFARGAMLPEDDAALVELLLNGSAKPIDAALANGDIFMNVAGFGFDVDVVRYTEKYKQKYNGMLPYMLGIFKSLIYLSKTHVSYTADTGEARELDCTLLSACNGSRFAGGIRLAPKAEIADGLLDMCILKSVSRPRFLFLLPKYIKGKHLKYERDFIYFKAKSVTCVSNTVRPMQLDGEPIGTTPVTFTCLPHALALISGT